MIGLFDSGLGGLSIVRHVRSLLPLHDLIYLADSAFCPYGPLPREQVELRAQGCASWLIAQGAQLIVIACNTASAAAAETLRTSLDVPVVAMEPGIKPAIEVTRTGRVGVLATSGTLRGERFANLVERFADGVEVHRMECPALVELVEMGELSGPRATTLVAAHIAPLITAGVDTLVLGCTHFPALHRLIAEAAPMATIIDTGPAVAAQVARVACSAGLEPGSGTLRCATTGDSATVAPVVARVWGRELPIESATW